MLLFTEEDEFCGISLVTLVDIDTHTHTPISNIYIYIPFFVFVVN